MTPSERERAFRRAQLDVLRLRTDIQRGMATEITQLLKSAPPAAASGVAVITHRSRAIRRREEEFLLRAA